MDLNAYVIVCVVVIGYCACFFPKVGLVCLLGFAGLWWIGQQLSIPIAFTKVLQALLAAFLVGRAIGLLLWYFMVKRPQLEKKRQSEPRAWIYERVHLFPPAAVVTRGFYIIAVILLGAVVGIVHWLELPALLYLVVVVIYAGLVRVAFLRLRNAGTSTGWARLLSICLSWCAPFIFFCMLWPERQRLA